MMASQILKTVDFTKAEKSSYLKKETLLFLQIKKALITYHKVYFMAKNSFLVEATFKS